MPKRTIRERITQQNRNADFVSYYQAAALARYRAPLPAGFSAWPGEALLRVSESFGDRLRRLREEQGFSVTDLASSVGVSDSAIRQLELGNVKSPSFALGLRIADRLNVDPHYLALGAGFSMTDRIDGMEKRLVKVEQRVAAISTSRR